MAGSARPTLHQDGIAGDNPPGSLAGAILTCLPALAAGGIEVALLRAYMPGRIGWPVLAIAHLAIVALLVAWAILVGRRGSNAATPLLTAITVAAAGPIGAMASILTILLTTHRSEDPACLRAWYDRIAMAGETDEATRLCENVATGRTSDLTGHAPASFVAVMERGSLDDRQAALGIIARNFHPDFLPVLMLALKSPEPVIRVQAAAVATKVRGDLRALVDRHTGVTAAALADGPGALVVAAELESAIASGLLDESDRIRAGTVAERIRVSAAGSRDGRALLTPLPVLARRSAEELLLRERRFAELRVQRRLAAVADAGSYTVRRPRRRAAARIA